MPVDYSKFNNLVDSDDEDGGLQLPFQMPFANDTHGDEDDSPGGSQRVSPREALRKLQEARATEPSDQHQSKKSMLAAGFANDEASVERLACLLEASEEVAARDDPFELISSARAAVQSGLLAGEFQQARRLMQAAHDALGRSDPPEFALQQAPELIAEVLLTASLIQDEGIRCEEILKLMLSKCRAQEVYTFTVEALCDHDLDGKAKVLCIQFLSEVLGKLDVSRRHLFLSSCLPVALKVLTAPDFPAGLFSRKLEAFRILASAHILPRNKADGADMSNEEKVMRSVASACLFKATERTFLTAAPSCLILEDEEAPGWSKPEGGAPSVAASDVKRSRGQRRVAVALADPEQNSSLDLLASLARDAAAFSASSLLTLCEELDLSDPCGDGGGDSEVSPLSVAAWVCLSELHGRHQLMYPEALPVCLSAARALNILMRSVYVLLENRAQDQSEMVEFSGNSIAASSSGAPGRSTAKASGAWPTQGLALFADRAVPMLQVAAVHTPRAVSSLHGAHCRWRPAVVFRAVLECLTSHPDLERSVRASLFGTAAAAMRLFDWPCRFELYMDIIQGSRTDSVIGAVVTLLKDDWWKRACDLAAKNEPLHEERGRLVKVFKATLSGDVQIIDGMDTLTASLNIARLVTLAKSSLGEFMRQSLRGGPQPSIDLEAALAKVSSQIDFELRLLQSDAEQAPTSALARQLAEELGKAEGAPDLNRMKTDRIAMVAHLVARVRELLVQDAAQ